MEWKRADFVSKERHAKINQVLVPWSDKRETVMLIFMLSFKIKIYNPPVQHHPYFSAAPAVNLLDGVGIPLLVTLCHCKTVNGLDWKMSNCGFSPMKPQGDSRVIQMN